jgi:RNA polymerase sigma factor (sigma-70 family)
VERHHDWIYRAARRRLGDDHLADDAAQAVFIVLIAKTPELILSQRGSLSAWLFHVVHFTCARMRRTQSRKARIEQAAGEELGRTKDPGNRFDDRLLLLLEDGVAQLPPAERELIVRRFYRHQRLGEIGRAFGISPDAARKRVNRAITEVKNWMLQNDLDAIPDNLLAHWNRSGRRVSGAAGRAASDERIQSIIKRKVAMTEQQAPAAGGHQMISAEFLVMDVETNLRFFEALGFPRRFIDQPDETGKIPRASLTAGKFGKIWIRRATASDIRPSPSINVFFWIDGGPDGLVAYRKKLVNQGLVVSSIIDEHGLPNFNVTSPDGYSVAFFTQYVAPGEPAIVLVQ